MMPGAPGQGKDVHDEMEKIVQQQRSGGATMMTGAPGQSKAMQAEMERILMRQKEAVGTELVALHDSVVCEGESTHTAKVGKVQAGERIVILEEKFSDLSINTPNVFGKPITRVRFEGGWVSKTSHNGGHLFVAPDHPEAQKLKPPEPDVYDRQVQKWVNPMDREPELSKVQGSSGIVPERKWDPSNVGFVQTPLDNMRGRINDDVKDKRIMLAGVLCCSGIASVLFIYIIIHAAGWTCDDKNECA
jgi:hypothetical protein